MSQTAHRIRRLTWLVRANTQAEALQARAALNAAWPDVMLGEFAEACDALTPTDVVLRISRLEVHVDVTTSQSLGAGMSEKVSMRLADQLRTVRAGMGREGNIEAQSARETSSAANALGELLEYLESGSLHWSATGADANDAARRMQVTALDAIAAVVQRLAEKSDENSWFRLMQLLNGDHSGLLRELQERLTHKMRAAVIPLLQQTLRRDSPNRHAALRATSLLVSVAFGAPSSRLAEKYTDIIRALPSADQANANDLLRQLLGQLPSEPAASQSPTDGDVSANANTNPTAVERLAVSNAGLVLLHPFLPAILSRVGLAAENTIPADDLPRAAALLHHVATGRTDVHEFELGLIKVLLGIAPEAPLPVAEGLLAPSDIEESDAMVDAMISHWSAIGKTSIAGVRSTFLMRAGLLALEGQGWTLHVEPSSFDMLLDRLPWGFGVIRLPWMQRPLHTQWTH